MGKASPVRPSHPHRNFCSAPPHTIRGRLKIWGTLQPRPGAHPRAAAKEELLFPDAKRGVKPVDATVGWEAKPNDPEAERVGVLKGWNEYRWASRLCQCPADQQAGSSYGLRSGINPTSGQELDNLKNVVHSKDHKVPHSHALTCSARSGTQPDTGAVCSLQMLSRPSTRWSRCPMPAPQTQPRRRTSASNSSKSGASTTVRQHCCVLPSCVQSHSWHT